MKLALFDLDHTLLPIDSDQSWGEFTVRLGWHARGHFKARNDQFYADYVAGTLDVHEYVRFSTEAARVRGQAAAEAARADFMERVIRPAVLPQALELVKRHQDAGEQVIIITATNEFVTRPIADAFGVCELIAVQLARDTSGWITGEIDGIPSLREGKVARMALWLSDRGLSWADVEATFYSDSLNDLPLLEKVRHPVATNPDPRLRKIAVERGWRILDLFP